jgi:hypothetical protein
VAAVAGMPTTAAAVAVDTRMAAAERVVLVLDGGRLRMLQRLVPGGTRMDTASMLHEAASYLRFLKAQLEALESAGPINPSNNGRGLLLLQPSYAGNDLASGGGGTAGGGGGTVYLPLDQETALVGT